MPNPSAARMSADDSALGPQRAERRRAAALRQFCPARVKDEPVVAIARRGQIEQRLQEPVNRGRGKEVASAHDVGDALERIVDRHRQMIARREIAPPENARRPTAPAPQDERPRSGPRRIRSRPDRPERPRSRVACRGAMRLFRRARGEGRIRRRKARGMFPNRAGPRPGRARRKRARLPRGCKSTDRRARAT